MAKGDKEAREAEARALYLQELNEGKARKARVPLLDTLNHPIFTKQVVRFMHPFFSTLNVNQANTLPVYAQLTEQITVAIKKGVLQPHTRLFTVTGQAG